MRPTLRTSPADERGVALVAVLLLMTLMSALGTALVMGATTETFMARNFQSAAEARAIAEAGLNHAVEVTIARLQQWQANGFATRSAAVTAMLRGPDNQAGSTATDADNGSLEALGIPRSPQRITLGQGGYEARVLDDDDPAGGFVLSAADRTRIKEDGAGTTDANATIVVRAVGYGTGRSRVTIQATIGRPVLPGILSNQSLLINGNATIDGSQGAVHANVDLAVVGSPTISQSATASEDYSETGNPSVGGVSGGGFANVAIPPVQALDYRQRADYVLTVDGKIHAADDRVTKAKGRLLCNAQANANACKNSGWGWTFSTTNGWHLGDTSVPPVATYYVEGDATISGSPGSNAVPVQMSVVAEGNIQISGSPYIVPKDLEVLFVTNEDLAITGNLTVLSEGLMLVREQAEIGGSTTLAGQLVIESAAAASDLVTENRMFGNVRLTYNGLVGVGGFTVTAWRRTR